MNVGETIKQIRKEKNLTQRELGEKLGGISQQQIGQWENGDKHPKLETLQKIAEALEVSVNDLISDSFDLTLQIGREAMATDYFLIEGLVNHKIFSTTQKTLILKEIAKHTTVLEKMDDVDKMTQYHQRTFNQLTHTLLNMLLEKYKKEDVYDIVVLLSCFLSLRKNDQEKIIELLNNNFYE